MYMYIRLSEIEAGTFYKIFLCPFYTNIYNEKTHEMSKYNFSLVFSIRKYFSHLRNTLFGITFVTGVMINISCFRMKRKTFHTARTRNDPMRSHSNTKTPFPVNRDLNRLVRYLG